MGLIQDCVEHKAIRETVANMASRYGVQYFTERARSGGGIDELWKDLGAAGLLGLHLPEEYGGGGGGMAEAVVVVEELAAHGMPLLIWVISPAICGNRESVTRTIDWLAKPAKSMKGSPRTGSAIPRGLASGAALRTRKR